MLSTKRKPFHLRLWHRRIGLTAALFALLLSITGLLLNHTEDLNLDSSYVKSGWLLDWYGIKAPKNLLSFEAGGHWISQLGERFYFDGHELAGREVDEDDNLIGAVKLGDNIIVAVEGHVMLLSLSGELIETLGGAEGVPAGMRTIGLDQGRLVVRASHGDYLTDKDLLHWDESEEGETHIRADADWARPAALPKNLYDQLAGAYRGKGLTTERVLLDLHSGRILSTPGVLLVDLMAILITLLAITGVWMWVRHARRENNTK
jgi:hypothetical protein